MRVRRFAVAIVAAALMVGGASLFATESAEAADFAYCYTSVAYSSYCPGNFGSGHQRHTFKNNRVSWGTVIKPGCTHRIVADSYIAYTNSVGRLKYSARGCNYVTDKFGNNTELLRVYGAHFSFAAVFLAGRAAF